jgi:cytochrome c553
MKKDMKFAGNLIFARMSLRFGAGSCTHLGAALVLGFAALASTAYAETPGEKDAKYGKAPAATCIGCHGIEGYKASFPNIYSVPKISGQSQKYIENSLLAYRKGERSHPTMKAIAAALSDADITALAAYYSKNAAVAK